MIYFRPNFILVCIALAVLTVAVTSGCCSRSAPIRKKDLSASRQELTGKTPSEDRSPGADDTIIDGTDAAPLSDREKRTSQLYQRMEYAFEMFRTDNIDGALREVERVQLELNNDPYLEMQTWYLSAMIYHKSGKTSRRKRSMRKMLEVMEQLQKDPRFRQSLEDGLISQDVIKQAIEKGEGRYAEQ
jgi:hypothetical protein